MAKLPRAIDKIWLQRAALFGLIGVITYQVTDGYSDYHKQVKEYMQSLAYRKAQEDSKDYNVKALKRNQALLSKDSKKKST